MMPHRPAIDEGQLTLTFGDSGVQAVLKAIVHPQHLVLEVLSVSGDGIEEFTFIDVPLALQGVEHEPFAACALALNLRTNVSGLPRPASQLLATCYPKFGFAGAKVALVAAPRDKLRGALQEAVTAAEELPHSSLGGPWALGQPINQGSYLFNFGGMTVEKADDWIKLAKTLGMTQIDFHGGGSFRFGDCRPNPQTYPEGQKSLKAVVDKLHAAGIAAGFHTYAFFIAKDCPWVTPVPDPRLASDAAFTLAADLAIDAAAVHVAESTAGISAITGFFVRNSVTLRIDDELVTYTACSQGAAISVFRLPARRLRHARCCPCQRRDGSSSQRMFWPVRARSRDDAFRGSRRAHRRDHQRMRLRHDVSRRPGRRGRVGGRSKPLALQRALHL